MKSNALKKITFYDTLATIIQDKEAFNENYASKLLNLYDEIKSDLSIETVTMDFLRKTRELNLISVIDEELVDAVFKDLARHLRNPEVQQIFTEFAEMAGTWADYHLYVCTAGVRPLTENPDGMAVVTLVVSNYARLNQVLAMDNGPDDRVHSVRSLS